MADKAKRFHCGFTLEQKRGDEPVNMKKLQRAFKRAMKVVCLKLGTVTHASLSESVNEVKD